jgi:predicted transcriptional regulator
MIETVLSSNLTTQPQKSTPNYLTTLLNQGDLVTLAKYLVSLGFSVVPLYSRKGQDGFIELSYTGNRKDLQIKTEYDIKKFFAKSKTVGIAIRCGKISNLIAIDIDNLEAFEKFYPLEQLKQEAFYIVLTPSGGYHLAFSYDEEFSKGYKFLKEAGFELKSNGDLINFYTIIPDYQYKILKFMPLKPMPSKFKTLIKELIKEKIKNSSVNSVNFQGLDLNLQDILSRLEKLTNYTPRERKPGIWRAKCPAHDDKEPSLDVELNKGKLQFYCWAGCKPKDILQALNLPTTQPKEKPKEELLSQEFLDQLYEEMQKKPAINTDTEKFIYIEINKKKGTCVQCNYVDLSIEFGKIKTDEDTNTQIFEPHYKVFNCCIQSVYAVENPLTGERKYEIHFVSKNPEEKLTVLRGTVREIWEALNLQTSYVLSNSVGLQVLTTVLNHFLEKNWYQKKQEELPPGFYAFNGKLHAQGFEEKTYTKKDLQKAAQFLNEYIYSHPNPLLISSIVKAGLLLPFSFAQKQLVHQGKLRKRIKYIYLYGESRSGKTTTAMLLSKIWGTDYKTNYASFCTEARAGKLLSTSTHILIIDEVNKDLETNPVKELLKFAYEDLIARTIQSKTLKQIHYSALAGIIMTSNSHFPEDPALLQRFWIFRFKRSDKISTSARNKYEKEDFRCLEALGQFVWNYIKQHGLKDDYINYTVEILKAFYKEAGEKAEWLDWAFTDDTSQTEEEQLYNKQAEFFTAVQKFFNHHIKPRENIQYGKLIYEALKLGQFGRWIWVDDKKFVYLSKDFLLELKKSYKCNIRDLEELSELIGWQKKQKRYKDTKIYVVSTTITEFLYKLNYIPTLLDSYEFDLWLNNKLEIQTPEEDTNNEPPF